MKTFRIRVRVAGHFITPLYADTIWGHLCWLVKWKDGEAALTDFLKAFEKEPPFILSDAFPGDYLPAPVHISSLVGKGDDRTTFREQKKLKKLEWLSFDEFKTVQKGQVTKPPDEDRHGFRWTTTLHSSINRLTGTTGVDGSLFEVEEYVLEKGIDHLSIYLKIKEGWEERVLALFKDLGRTGYGKKKSVGKGAFEVSTFEPFDGFDLPEANAFVSLSNFVPAENDPNEGFYKVFVKYGKLGGEYAFSGKPFKKPLMMVKAGSVFKCNTLKPFYGRMVKDLLLEMPDVVQYGYGFPVPVRVNPA